LQALFSYSAFIFNLKFLQNVNYKKPSFEYPYLRTCILKYNDDLREGIFVKRLTKIVCTLGPSTSDYDSINNLVNAGMDIARLNFSHGNYSEHKRRIEIIKKISKENRKIKIMEDLPGPKIRVGKIKNSIHLKEKSKIILADSKLKIKNAIPVKYSEFSKSVSENSTILLCDGAIKLKTLDIIDDKVICRVERGGILSSNKGVNILGTTSEIGSITPEDIRHIRFGIDNNVDFIAASFVTSANDIKFLKSIVLKDGAHTPIISKIEKIEALRNLQAIVKESDAVMVARGDMGVEIGLENVPLEQKRIIKLSNKLGRPVIVATQMLYSMIDKKMPTRAEISDAANAIIDGADALMLSEETTVGKYPCEAVGVLNSVALRIEQEKGIRKRLLGRNGVKYKIFK
jgi:pyruvate kinase